MHKMLDQPPSFSPSKCTLAHIVLALGAHILGSDGRRDRPKGSAYDPMVQFTAAMKLKLQLLEQKYSLRNFQVCLILQSLLSAQANCAQRSLIIMVILHGLLNSASTNSSYQAYFTASVDSSKAAGLLFDCIHYVKSDA